MGQELKNIDDLFKHELGSYAETPPPMAWDALEKRLDKVPPRPAGFLTGNAVYMVLIASLLLLSVSVANKFLNAPRQMANASQGSVSNTVPVAINKSAALTKDIHINRETGKNNISSDVKLSSATINNSSYPSDAPVGAPLTSGVSKTGMSKSTTDGSRYTASHRSPVQIAPRLLGRNHVTTNTHSILQDAGSKVNDEVIAHNEKTIADPAIYEAQPQNPATRPAEEQPLAETGDKTAAPKQPAPQPAPDQKQPTKPVQPAKPKVAVRQKTVRFEAGIKAGFESGFSDGSANKWVVSPYVQYNLSQKFALMVQPAVKTASVATRSIGKTASYYKQNNDSAIVTVKDAYPVLVPLPDGSGIDSFALYHYHYSQSHDSIVKSHTLGGNYTEYELPVLLKYNIVKGLSVYGGVNLVYSTVTSIEEHTSTQTIRLSDTANYAGLAQYGAPAPAPQVSVNQVFHYAGTEISQYKNPYTQTTGGMVRLGYMLGFSVEYKQRWLLDGLMQQTPVPASVQGGYNINNALSSTYFRFTVGYKILK